MREGVSINFENRKAVRLAIDMNIKIEEVNAVEQQDTQEEFSVEVVDISMLGIGFLTNYKLKINAFYKANIVFPTKEKMDIVLETVRDVPQKNGSRLYGGVFVGMSELDKFKIEVFRLFAENERNQLVV